MFKSFFSRQIGGGTSGDTWASHDQQCCLVDNGRRCTRVAGNASYNKRIQKTVAQKKLKLHMDNSVSNYLFIIVRWCLNF